MATPSSSSPSWRDSAPCFTYRNVIGTKTCFRGKQRKKTGYSPDWDEFCRTSPGQSIYEEIDPPNASWRKEHVILLTSALTPDDEVPKLKRKADQWDALTTSVPGFTRAMLVLSDLVYYTNGLVIDDLNEALRKRGVTQVDFVAGVLFRLSSDFHSEREKTLIVDALGDVFGAGTLHDALRYQWTMVWAWKNKRLMFAHPIRDMDEKELVDLKTEIKDGDDYTDVRDVAELMINMLLTKRGG